VTFVAVINEFLFAEKIQAILS